MVGSFLDWRNDIMAKKIQIDELEEFEAYAKKHNLTNAQVIKNGIKLQIELDQKESNG